MVSLLKAQNCADWNLYFGNHSCSNNSSIHYCIRTDRHWQKLMVFLLKNLGPAWDVGFWFPAQEVLIMKCLNECQISGGCIKQINDLCLQGLSGCEGAEGDPQAGRFNAPQYLLRQFLRWRPGWSCYMAMGQRGTDTSRYWEITSCAKSSSEFELRSCIHLMRKISLCHNLFLYQSNFSGSYSQNALFSHYRGYRLLLFFYRGLE